uniref:Putative ovule protein n=1 Tax=Solanum chacoense TaxID=4108 RepID=A0A0V0GV80_SOLCH
MLMNVLIQAPIRVKRTAQTPQGVSIVLAPMDIPMMAKRMVVVVFLPTLIISPMDQILSRYWSWVNLPSGCDNFALFLHQEKEVESS